MDENKRLMKTQTILTAALAVIGVFILITLIICAAYIVPAAKALRQTADTATAAITDLTEVTDVLSSIDLEGIADDLGDVSGELSGIEWEKIAKDIDKTATDAQKGLQSALDAIDEIDIDSLNEAIEDLGTVVRPLANLVEKFR